MRLLFVILISTGAMFAGCGPAKEASKTESITPPIEKTPPRKTPSRRKKKPEKIPRSADAAVEAFLSGIRNKKPEVLWAFLPASYQRDVNGIFHLLAEKMDRELWEKTFQTGLRIVRICRVRRAAILDSELIAPGAGTDAEALAKEWDTVVTLAGTLLTSDLADLEKMKQFNGGRFLKMTGGKFMKELALASRLLPGDALKFELDEFARLQVKLESQEDDTAIVQLSLRNNDTPPKRVPFVLVEGKWIPKNLADSWKAEIAAIRNRMESQLAPKVLAEKKRVVMQFLATVEMSLKELEDAKTPAEFKKRFRNSIVAETVNFAFRELTRPDSRPSKSVVPGNAGKKKTVGKARVIIVTVSSALDAATAEKIADKLFNLATDADVGGYRIGTTDTRFPVTTAVEFAAFVKSIKFAKVVKADAKALEVVIELN